jgi:hypothetical protein
LTYLNIDNAAHYSGLPTLNFALYATYSALQVRGFEFGSVIGFVHITLQPPKFGKEVDANQLGFQ